MEPVPQPWRAIEPAPEPSAAPSPGSSWWLPAAIVGSAALLVALLAAGWVLVASAPQPRVTVEGSGPPPDPGDADAPGQIPITPSNAPSGTPAAIVVDVEGAVLEPGLYRLPAGSRVGDAVAAAGGYSTAVDAAATSQTINLAEELADGAKIRIPARGEATPALAGTGSGSSPLFGAGGSTSATAPASPLDLNTATQAELESLPGIGPVTAQKIIDARSQAPFVSVEELQSRGILGPKTYEKIAPLVTVGG